MSVTSKTKIDPFLSTRYSFNKREVFLKIGLATLVALAAISLGIVALQAIGGVDVGIFHCLGGMGDITAWVLIGVGSGILTYNILYLFNKLISHLLRNRCTINFFADDAEILKKMQSLLSDESEIRSYFEYLKNQKIPGGRGLPVNESKKFCCWNAGCDSNSTEGIVFVLQMNGNERAISGFSIPKTQGEDKPDNRPLGTFETYVNQISDAGYTFVIPMMKNEPSRADYTDHTKE